MLVLFLRLPIAHDGANKPAGGLLLALFGVTQEETTEGCLSNTVLPATGGVLVREMGLMRSVGETEISSE